MENIISDTGMVAYCGLYCGACRAFLNGKCPGCHENEKAGWCKIRKCSIEKNYSSCADCKDFPDPMECKKFNNLISKIFAFVFRSDRAACIRQIKDSGIQAHADRMTELKTQSLKR